MLKNLAEFHHDHLVEIFNSEQIINLDSDFRAVGVSTDSRQIEAGNIFIALIGENFDAHQKIGEAFEKGATLVIASDLWYNENAENYEDKSFIVVEDTLVALGILANSFRKRFDCKLVAVGGSNGKTTTKEMIAAVLSKKYNVLKSHGNFNNRVGVPFNLFQINEATEVAVIEIGTNEPGEIAILTKMAEPTHGIITNIGKEHLEKLEDIDGVEMEETFLFGYLRRHHNMAFINMDDARLRRYHTMLEKKYVYGQVSDLNLSAKITFDINLNPLLEFTTSEELNFSVKLSTFGYPSAINAIAATAVGLNFGVEEALICEALESFEALKGDGYGRMVVEQYDNYTLLNDCYNANPSSMHLAIDTLRLFPKSSVSIAVLGEMRELGASSIEEHKELIKFASENCNQVCIIGKDFAEAYKSNTNYSNVTLFETKSEIASYLNSIKESKNVLVKGSRGMRMEEVIALLEN